MMRSSYPALLLSLVVQQAHAQEATRPKPVSAESGARPEKRVCRSDVPTGSLFVRRVCRTAAEWAAIDGSNHKGADHLDHSVGHVGFGSSFQGALP